MHRRAPRVVIGRYDGTLEHSHQETWEGGEGFADRLGQCAQHARYYPRLGCLGCGLHHAKPKRRNRKWGTVQLARTRDTPRANTESGPTSPRLFRREAVSPA